MPSRRGIHIQPHRTVVSALNLALWRALLNPHSYRGALFRLRSIGGHFSVIGALLSMHMDVHSDVTLKFVGSNVFTLVLGRVEV